MEEKYTYYTIEKKSNGFFKDKGSKFFSFAFHVQNKEDIKRYQQELRKKYHDARHHVYAWRLGIEEDNYRYSDDGEPSNSSGPPILRQIRSYNLTNILIVVIRYFGGTKLGIPGLINAYKTATKDAIDNNLIIEKIIKETYRISFPYENMNTVMRIVKEQNWKQSNQIFETQCQIDVKIELKNKINITALFEQWPQIKIKRI
jgi:uncharacterized YigZ family protein